MQAEFQQFFDSCVGQWIAERTYHYLRSGEIERSRTEFQVEPLAESLKLKVLEDNQYAPPGELSTAPGYHLHFHTVSETGEEVAQQLNFLFVPRREEANRLEGDYLRDRAYEEARPIISQFRFNPETYELQMTTQYTRVVSVDSITLANPNLRLRKILNYLRPPPGEPLKELALVGFGLEQKRSS